MTTIKRVLLSLLAITASGALLLGIGIANAETPAQRCKRETTEYNNAWKNTWAQTNPGKDASKAPPPPVPYKCGSNSGTAPSLPSTTSSRPAPESSAAPTTAGPDANATEPSMNQPTERREIEHPQSGQPIITGQATPPATVPRVNNPHSPGIYIPTGRANQNIVLTPTEGTQVAHERRGDVVSIAVAKPSPQSPSADFTARLPAGTTWQKAGRGLQLVDSDTGSSQALLTPGYGNSVPGANGQPPLIKVSPSGVAITFPEPVHHCADHRWSHSTPRELSG